MTREQIFAAWAPTASIWSPWAKPVLFSHMPKNDADVMPAPTAAGRADPADGTTTMVVDLPGAGGIAVGLSLAKVGYRPVPLYNACPEGASETSTVEVRPIMIALTAGASALLNFPLADDAPPAFLLDSNRRMSRVIATPGMLDNRSISLPTDFPSGNFLLSRGIQKVVLVQVRSASPQADLCHTLRRWQEAGLKINTEELDKPTSLQPIIVKRPSSFKVFFYNLLATTGLRSNLLGGFGGRLPIPGSG